MTYLLLTVFIGLGVAYPYFMVQAFKHCKEGRGWIVLFPFWMLMSGSFYDDGRKYRVAAIKVSFLMGLVLIVIFNL